MKHLKKINEIMVRDVEDWREQQYQDYQASLSEDDEEEEINKCELCGDEFDDVDLDLYTIDGKDVMCCKYCREEMI